MKSIQFIKTDLLEGCKSSTLWVYEAVGGFNDSVVRIRITRDVRSKPTSRRAGGVALSWSIRVLKDGESEFSVAETGIKTLTLARYMANNKYNNSSAVW